MITEMRLRNMQARNYGSRDDKRNKQRKMKKKKNIQGFACEKKRGSGVKSAKELR
jgi:hypothetical protein